MVKVLAIFILLVLDIDKKFEWMSRLDSKSSKHDFNYQPSFVYLDFHNVPISL